jgi:ATP-dependent Clp protease ATP-binding subunit ClpA
VPGLLDKLSIGPSAVQLAVDRELERLPKVTGSVDTSKVYVTQSVNDVLTRAESEAKSLKDEFVSVEHLLLGLLDVGKPDALKNLFKSFGLDRSKLLKVLKEVRGSQRVTTDNPEATYAALENMASTSWPTPARARWTPSSAAMRRSVARSASFPARRRTIPSSSASPASARPRSSRASPSASCAATCPRA